MTHPAMTSTRGSAVKVTSVLPRPPCFAASFISARPAMRPIGTEPHSVGIQVFHGGRGSSGIHRSEPVGRESPAFGLHRRARYGGGVRYRDERAARQRTDGGTPRVDRIVVCTSGRNLHIGFEVR